MAPNHYPDEDDDVEQQNLISSEEENGEEVDSRTPVSPYASSGATSEQNFFSAGQDHRSHRNGQLPMDSAVSLWFRSVDHLHLSQHALKTASLGWMADNVHLHPLSRLHS